MSRRPAVSVVIPCYNGAAFLRETLASVLGQTQPVLEVIVVDDGSTDDSADIAASFGPPVRVIRQPNQGESVARNRGVRESRGEWVAFLDADDVWLPERIEAQFAQSAPDAVAMHCNLIFFGAENYTTRIEETPAQLRYSPAELCCRNWFHTPSAVIVRRDVCPPFPEQVRYGEDLLFFLEIVQAGPVSLCTEPLVRYRQHDFAQSFRAETRIGWFRTIDAWMAQNRDKVADDAAESVRQFWLQELARFAWLLKEQRRWDDYWQVRRFLGAHRDSAEVDEVLSHHVYPRVLYRLKDRFSRGGSMKMRAFSRLAQSARRAAALLRPSVAILMYHRVHHAVTDPWDLCVSPTHFAEQMEYLRRHFAVLSLRELTRLLAAGRLPRRAIVLTFDDGYADNLLVAKPVLERWELPATFFVTTGGFGQSREFWWDELSRLFLEPGTLPETLDVMLDDGQGLRWELADSAVYTDEDCRRHSAWRAAGSHDPTPRHAIVRALNERLYRLPELNKRQILDRLFMWAEVSPDGRPNHRSLSPEDLIAAEDGGLVAIGAHSVTHSVLPALPAAAQRDEITQCKARLEEILSHPVREFCYPHGAYAAETIALVRNAAFRSACSVASRPLGPDADPFQLPRIHARDWGGDEFARQLRACMNPQ